jgi:uncharacterized surface protein with fasciclin (FAS1) repeats
MNPNRWYLFLTVMIVLGFSVASLETAVPVHADTFTCEDLNTQQSIVDALEETGVHSRFLQLMQEHDPEGYEILNDVALADKTVWAPVDDAFNQIDSTLQNYSSAEIKTILGYHISPPLSRPNGEYPIVSWDYLRANPNQVFRTRTGVLSGADQRLQLTVLNDDYWIETAMLLPTMWCAQEGSVFAIDSVILEVEPPSTLTFIGYRLVRILLYEDIRFTIYATAAGVVIGTAISFVIRKRRRSL